MNGLTLSRDYYINVAEPELRRSFTELYPRLAAGLIGNGSECFGFDDELSRDHDWGVDFYIWTTDADAGYIPELAGWKARLLDTHPPELARERSYYGAGINVMTCGDFYKSLIGAPEGPENQAQWLRAPEENLAMCVNGAVFYDGAGELTKTRSYLLGYYPEDIRLKRISARCMSLAQTGQYNLERTVKRGDTVTLRSVLARFNDSVIAMVFLLNKVYRPYYKWAYRRMTELPVLGGKSGALLKRMAETEGYGSAALNIWCGCVTELCAMIVEELKRQGLTDSDDWFLTAHGEEVRRRIDDEFLRSLPTQYEI